MVYLFGIPGPQEYAIIIAGVVIMAFTLSDIVFGRFKNVTDKILWLLIVVFLPLLGCVVYYFFGRQHKVQKA